VTNFVASKFLDVLVDTLRNSLSETKPRYNLKKAYACLQGACVHSQIFKEKYPNIIGKCDHDKTKCISMDK